MTLEQRVEALEKQMAAPGNGQLAVKVGEVYISDALISACDQKTAPNEAVHELVNAAGAVVLRIGKLS